MGLTREQILAIDDVPTKDVPVPEWGDGATVRVRCLTAGERLEWGMASRKAIEGAPGPDPTTLLIVLAAVNDDGTQMFQTQDVDNLAQKRGDVVERLASEVMSVSGLAGDAVAEAEGNSGTTPSGGSPSDSPPTSE